MTLHKLMLAALLGIILTSPLHGAATITDPYYKLTEGFYSLEAEDIIYRGYYFFVADGVDPGVAARQLQGAMAGRDAPPETRWAVTGGLEPGDTVLQVKGASYHHCRDLLEELRLSLEEEPLESALSWQVEALVQSDTGDLPDLGREFVNNLGGRLHSVARYNGSVHMLAYTPRLPDQLSLAEGPVNLNLELYEDPLSGRVRLRAGIPVLLSLSHYPD